MLDTNEAKQLFAAYKAVGEMKFRDHGAYTSLEDGEGFWVFVGVTDPIYVTKTVIEKLSALVLDLRPSQVEEVVPAPTPEPQPTNSSGVSWEDPDIVRRLSDIAGEALAEDTKYVRVIAKDKSGKQTTITRIAQGTSRETVVQVIMGARRRTKQRTVMAEVLKSDLRRTMARSFPLELKYA